MDKSDVLETLADSILRAAGSSLSNYTMPGTRQAIMNAVSCAVQSGANTRSPVTDADCSEAAARITALEAENERLRKALAEANKAEWFYYGDDQSSDCCRFNIDECIDEDFESEAATDGDHVLQISGARPVPDMWIALHYFSDAEKDERQDDEPYIYTVHATQDEARQALGGPHG